MALENRNGSPRFLEHGWSNLTERERNIIQHVLIRAAARQDVEQRIDDERTLGERLSDRLAAFGGSWRFILTFFFVLAAWLVVNGVILARVDRSFDPFPFILLNLVLSMLAAIQAPVILMSQNRQAAKDRLQSTYDYEVDLKAELEIVSLHQKLDELRAKKWEDLIALQLEQTRILQRLLEASVADKDASFSHNCG